MTENNAVVNGMINASTKYCVNIGRFVRGKNIDSVIKYLDKVMHKKAVIPWRTHNDKVPHKRGMGPGKYPVKASREIIKLLESVKSNAKNKGMNEEQLIIKEFIPNRMFSEESRSRYSRGKWTYLKIGVVEKK